MEHLFNKLKQYNSTDFYPYHMPGHKRILNGNIDKNFFEIDITEIPGFDDLHNSEGILKCLQEKASFLYGADQTYYLVNGSSCGVMAAICGSFNKRGKIIMARNCHKSAYYAAYLAELDIEYVLPQKIEGTSIYEAISIEEIKESIEKNPDALGVVLVSPTYEGRICDINKIAELVHSKGMILVVDQAHGAHLGFSKYFEENACRLGADVVIMSTHKTLPAFTQTALLHINGNRVNRENIKKYLDIFQTSSPSYILMSGIDNCLQMIEEDGEKLFEELYFSFKQLLKELKACKNLQFLPSEKDKLSPMEGHDGEITHDIGKLVICTSNTPYTGQGLYDILLKKYHLQLEMAVGDYCLAMFTVGDCKEGFERLSNALIEIDKECLQAKVNKTVFIENAAEIANVAQDKKVITNINELRDKKETTNINEHRDKKETESTNNLNDVKAIENISTDEGINTFDEESRAYKIDVAKRESIENTDFKPVCKIPIYKAWLDQYEEVNINEASGRIAAQFVYLYPPGVPVLVPGELVSNKILKLLEDYREMNLNIYGLYKDGKTIRVRK